MYRVNDVLNYATCLLEIEIPVDEEIPKVGETIETNVGTFKVLWSERRRLCFNEDDDTCRKSTSCLFLIGASRDSIVKKLYD